MDKLLSIGKVSKIKQVSIKSLRYYDEIGVFKPAYINSETNYRYYTQDQLFILDAINLCIELGIPLKDLYKYLDSNHNLDLQKLLFDGKLLAEQKIKRMGSCLEKIQLTLDQLENQSHSKFQKDFYIRDLLPRTVLVTPFDDYTEATHYSHKLLELFVFAQKNQLKANYPSGLIYQFHKGEVKKLVFVHVEGDVSHFQNVTLLPSGKYLCRQNKEHRIDHYEEVFDSSFLRKQTYQIIETDMIDTYADKNKNTFELQLLL